MKKYLVIGAGHQGLAMAAHLSLNGEKVNLWNRSPDNISKIMETHKINCCGIIEGIANIEKVSSRIDDVMEKIIFIATPATAHKDIAQLLASRVNDETTIILNPGRTFGALEFEKELIKAGCKKTPKIAETNTIVYTCRRDKENNIKVMAMKNNVKIASIKKEDIRQIFNDLPNCLKKYFKIEESILNTSLNNVGLLLHCAPTLMNIGWIENPKYDFQYYTEGITESVSKYIEKIDLERLAIGKKLNIKLDPICKWFKTTYNVSGNLLECVKNDVYAQIKAPQKIEHRYLNEDIPFGLVPLESLGKLLQIKTPYISTIISLASLVMNKNYREIGVKIKKYELEKIKVV